MFLSLPICLCVPTYVCLQDRRTRFPESVYAFFQPPRAVLAAANAETRQKLAREADESRWALYYGVKVRASAVCMHTALGKAFATTYASK